MLNCMEDSNSFSHSFHDLNLCWAGMAQIMKGCISGHQLGSFCAGHLAHPA